MGVDTADHILRLIGQCIVRINLRIDACLIRTGDDNVNSSRFQFLVQCYENI